MNTRNPNHLFLRIRTALLLIVALMLSTSASAVALPTNNSHCASSDIVCLATNADSLDVLAKDISQLIDADNTKYRSRLAAKNEEACEGVESGVTCRLGEVSESAAFWLFASALIGFVGLSSKRRV